MNLDPLLQAHPYLHVERPPVLWEVQAEDIRLVPVLGEMIAIGLGRGNQLRRLTLNASNVTVQPDTNRPDRLPTAGDYVALTIKGLGDWRPEWVWPPGFGSARTIYSDVEERLRESGAMYAYAAPWKAAADRSPCSLRGHNNTAVNMRAAPYSYRRPSASRG